MSKFNLTSPYLKWENKCIPCWGKEKWNWAVSRW